MSETLLQLARDILATQPFSVLLGTRLVSIDRGRASLELDVGPTVRQQYGSVHGGVMAYLVDNALAFAGGSVLGGEVVTVELKVNYLRPVGGDGRLIANATVLGSGKSLAVCRCEVYVDDGQRKLVAAGQGTIRRTGAGAGAPVAGEAQLVPIDVPVARGNQ